jgi:hypothetical protein
MEKGKPNKNDKKAVFLHYRVMMHTMIVTLLLLFLPSMAFPEVILKRVTTPDGEIKKIYYVMGREIARDVIKPDGSATRVGVIPDGKVYEYYKNGKLKTVLGFKDNRLFGTQKSFYENGSLQSVSDCDEGICTKRSAEGRIPFQERRTGRHKQLLLRERNAQRRMEL